MTAFRPIRRFRERSAGDAGAQQQADLSAPPRQPEPSPPPRDEPFVVEARRGEEHVVTLRVLHRDSRYVVECDLAGAMRKAGPYLFASHQDAKAFVDEASLAFQYLGCDVSNSRSAGAGAPLGRLS